MAHRVLYDGSIMKNRDIKNQSANQKNRPEQNAECAKRETAEQWWARISPGQKALAQVIAGMIDEVTESKRVEIRREMASIRARFIHILKQPENGCLSAIMLPELPARRGWN